MKKKLILFGFTFIIILSAVLGIKIKDSTKVIKIDENSKDNKLISVLVDGVEQSAFPSKGSATYQSTSCTNNETATWDDENWKLSIQDISASTRCVVSFVTGGHSVYVTVSGGSVDNAPKTVQHNGNETFTVSSSNSNYVFSSAKCTNVTSYSWANNVLSVNGVLADAYCEVIFARPTYTVYFDVVGGYTEDNYLTVVRGGGNSTTYGAVAGFLSSGSTISCDPGITGKIAGSRVVISNVLASGDCIINCARDTSNYLPAGGIYNRGDEVSYANLAWLVISDNGDTVTLMLQGNAIYSSTSSSNPTGTGIFGSGVTYTSSSARSYIVDIWLEQDSQKYLRNAIDTGGLEYQDSANGYLRLPFANEVSRDVPNASGTNFWTMDNDGNNHMYYGQPDGYLREGYNANDGKYYFEHYTLANNSSVTYSWATKLTGTFTNTNGSSTGTGTGQASATGTSTSVSAITNQFWSNKCTYGCCEGPAFFNSSAHGSFCSASGATRNATYPNSGCSGGCWTYISNTSDSARSAGGATGTCAKQTLTSSAKMNITAKYNVKANVTGTFSGTSTTSNNVTVSHSQTALSGDARTNGSSSTAYKPVVKGVIGSEVKNSAATLGTTHTYNAVTNTTVGNSGMPTAVQAVSPNGASARTNDSTPSTSTSSTTTTGITHAAQNTVSLAASIPCTNVATADATSINSFNSVISVNSYNSGWAVPSGTVLYQGYSTTSCDAIKTTTPAVTVSTTMPAASTVTASTVSTPAASTITNESIAPANVTGIKTGSIAANTASAVSSSTYTRYTLRQNTSTMGYRPVIVVLKAN